MNAALSLQHAMRAALIARAPLVSLLGGAHIFDEPPRGTNAPFISFTSIETRDWSVADQKAHEHFVSLEIVTNTRSRALAQSIAQEIETTLDLIPLALVDHQLINLRVIFCNIVRNPKTENFGGVIRFRAATEPN